MRLTGIVYGLFLVVHAASAANAPVAPRAIGSRAAPLIAPVHGVPLRRPIDGPTPAVEVPRPDFIDQAGHETADGPMEAVWGMFGAFADRSDADYAAWMSDDFRFDSDDPGFRASFPAGMDRAAEARFARHLFRGGKRSPDGRELPTATRVHLSGGPVFTGSDSMSDREAHVTLPHLQVSIILSDGSTLELSETRNELWLVRATDGWRVRRWLETHPVPAEHEAVARRLASAAGPRHDPSRTVLAHVPLAPPTVERIALALRMDRDHESLVFAVALPLAGGSLDVFDVMGRRIMRRDLSGLGAGHHVVALDGNELGAGVYWARVQQGADAATSRVVWTK